MWDRIKYSSPFLILLFVGFIWVLTGVYTAVSYAVKLYAESQEIDERTAAIHEKNRVLEAAILEFETTEAIERKAKEQLNLKKAGEEVVVVAPEKPQIEKAPEYTGGAWERLKAFLHGSY